MLLGTQINLSLEFRVLYVYMYIPSMENQMEKNLEIEIMGGEGFESGTSGNVYTIRL